MSHKSLAESNSGFIAHKVMLKCFVKRLNHAWKCCEGLGRGSSLNGKVEERKAGKDESGRKKIKSFKVMWCIGCSEVEADSDCFHSCCWSCGDELGDKHGRALYTPIPNIELRIIGSLDVTVLPDAVTLRLSVKITCWSSAVGNPHCFPFTALNNALPSHGTEA